MAHFITLVISLGAGVVSIALMSVAGFYRPEWDLPIQFAILFIAGFLLGWRFPGKWLPTLTGLCLPFVAAMLLSIRAILQVSPELGDQLTLNHILLRLSPLVAAVAGLIMAFNRFGGASRE